VWVLVHYVFTLGFHADHAIRRLSRARDVEAVVVVTARPVVRAVRNAFMEIVAFCDRAGLPRPVLLDLPLEDPAGAVYAVLRAVEGARRIVVDVSGGMRIVTLLTVVAAMIASRRSYVEVFASGEREDAPEARIPMLVLHALLFGGLGGEKRAILELLDRFGEMSVSDLAKAIDRSERTVRAHLADLKRYELVEGSAKIRISGWGRLLLALGRSQGS